MEGLMDGWIDVWMNGRMDCIGWTGLGGWMDDWNWVGG